MTDREQPYDPPQDSGPPDPAESEPATDEDALPPDTRSHDDEGLGTSRSYDESLGTSADVAGGSVSRDIRRPPPAE